ncbi:NAD(+)--dinitrogen-reductase ADP-D-ribosyltransferase [Geobacter sp. SVR]|uniref:NAD(+)--dinitrogen-reductase ADP-D-ribosyltransferase n=1 Tax=Geobacter sp. SVR TaxID=2495594 RepID=UPI00143EFE5C|nr:NAD(+)--dinitrogen-reductase ADP-D-ribosyltransferase [Geobacter sp. SVR]BCS55732.1 N-acyl homoserine lactonase [Geobacter sp. SVR]GCF83736.1 N-acyl homoserine lactonase [Geobacter sp. SVR]
MSFNYCNQPPWVIASRHFNRHPQRLEIQGVKEANRFLFEKLATIDSQEARAVVFNDYMSVKFQLHHWQEQTETARKSIRNSYLRFLRGWMMDSNSIEGAVLKRWVESRMGIPPTFHRAPVSGIHSEAYFQFSVDVMKGSARTNAIQSQLDLLYEYCQYELFRKISPETANPTATITLYRGTYDAGEHQVLEQVSRREQIVRLNNLVSFTSDEERAWEFGSTVWDVCVPLSKVFFYNDLLPGSIMKGEGEYLVIGGEYLVRQVMCTV